MLYFLRFLAGNWLLADLYIRSVLTRWNLTNFLLSILHDHDVLGEGLAEIEHPLSLVVILLHDFEDTRQCVCHTEDLVDLTGLSKLEVAYEKLESRKHIVEILLLIIDVAGARK